MPLPTSTPRLAPAADGAVVTKAVLRAGAHLGLSSKQLARIIGVSEATMSRMGAGAYVLSPQDKPFELAVLLIRLYRSLDAIVGGDAATARAWLANDNTVLGAPPRDLLPSVAGLLNVIAYLDARRAVG